MSGSGFFGLAKNPVGPSGFGFRAWPEHITTVFRVRLREVDFVHRGHLRPLLLSSGSSDHIMDGSSANAKRPRAEYPRPDYANKMILAPMVKIGTLPTRLLALEYGADLVYTEEIIDFRLLRSQRVDNTVLDTVDYIDRTDDTLVLRVSPRERGRLVLQIGTSNAARAVRVARMVEGDVDGIDVNMGCPKSFSLKGGMGAALLSHPDKIRDILTSLVGAVSIPVTCKIRILPSLEDTLSLVRVIASTGVAALAVHGRTKEERPNHENHPDVIREIVRAFPDMIIIANGGSGNSRASPSNTREGIISFWHQTGASSVMVARAAEWNPSVFREEGRLPISQVVGRYVDLAVEFDLPFTTAKYCLQQLLGSEQSESESGRQLLTSSTMGDLAAAFGRGEAWNKRQEFIRERSAAQSITSTTFRFRREARLAPKKRKLEETGEEVTEMFCPFVRGHYGDGMDIPKVRLLQWTRDGGMDPPGYATEQTDKTFRTVVTVAGHKFSSESWEKNKRYSEQAAAIVALHCLGIKKVPQAEEEKGASKTASAVFSAGDAPEKEDITATD